MEQLIQNLTIDETVHDTYMLQDISVLPTKNNKEYLSGNLVDKSGSIGFKLWNYDGFLLPDAGHPVIVTGKVTRYQQSKYLSLNRIEPAPKSSYRHIKELVPTAPVSIDEYKELLEQTIQEIHDVAYRCLIIKIQNDHFEDILSCPAGKSIHHDYLYGLLMHTVNMMRMASMACNVYPWLDKDLLLTATFLHDIGKPIKEFKRASNGLVETYTRQGVLMGHLVSGAIYLHKICEELLMEPEKIDKLIHCMISHHGEPEYGAAIRPAIPEAEILAQLDQMDTHMELFRKQLDSMEPESISEPMRYLDNRRLYKF